MKLATYFCVYILATALTACGGAGSFSLPQGINVSASNIASHPIGPVTDIKILPNTMVPKGVFVSLTHINAEFVFDLYLLIYKINETEGLQGMEGPDQEITLIVLSSDERHYAELQDAVRQALRPQAADPIPYLDVIYDSFASDLWMQDWGEFSSVLVAGSNERVFGVFDSGRFGGRGGIEPELFSSIFQTPFIALGQDSFITGNSGGNIEATHEGVAYVGDAISPALASELRAYGNQNLLVLPSEWLYVGHVDEYLSFLPADNRCQAALVYADTLLGLTLAASSGDADTSILEVSASEIRRGLQKFLRPSAAEGSTRLSDYNVGMAAETAAESYVLYNLRLQKAIDEAVAHLTNSAACLEQVVGLPQVFHEYDTWYDDSAIADAPGVTNSLILRNHIIVPDPKIPSFRELISSLLADITGNESSIHFIDSTVYHERQGEVHCGTNVIREHSLPFRY